MLRILPLLLLTGCTSFGIGSLFQDDELPPPVIPEVKIIKEEIPLRIYQPPLPPEIKLESVKFSVVNKDNLEEKILEIEKMLDGDFVAFMLTPIGYEKMAYNLQEVQRYILQQKEIILYYRKATQSDENSTAKDWLEKNEKE